MQPDRYDFSEELYPLPSSQRSLHQERSSRVLGHWETLEQMNAPGVIEWVKALLHRQYQQLNDHHMKQWAKKEGSRHLIFYDN